MKRGMILILVSCLAATAGAALQLDVTDGKVTVSGKLEIDMILGLAGCDGATLSNFVIGPAAPSNIIWNPDPDPFPIEFPFPEGCDGKWLFVGVFPGEQFKEGIYLTADVTPATSQEKRIWEEIVTEGCPEGQYRIRTFTEITYGEKGGVLLTGITADFSQGSTIDEVSLHKQTITTTYEDSICLPEPMTLSLFGLGLVVIRRKCVNS